MAAAIDSLSKAMSRAGDICFKPFNLGKWFALGFMAFLAGYVYGYGFNLPTNFTGGGRRGGPTPHEMAQEFLEWFYLHMYQIFIIGGIVFIVWLTVLAILSWLRCRAKFVFMDNIYRMHSLIVAPWKALKQQGDSFFLFTIIYGTTLMVLYALILVVCGAIAWPAITSRTVTMHVWVALFAGIAMMVVVMLASMVVFGVVECILLPVMYFRNVRMMEAYHIFRQQIVPGNIGQILLFFLMKIVTNMGIGLASLIVGCITCCCGFLPYISTVLTLPAHVFSQSYDMYFVASYLGIVFPAQDSETHFPVHANPPQATQSDHGATPPDAPPDTPPNRLS